MTNANFLDTLFAEFIPRTQDDALLLLQEGHFKCEVIHSLLHVGCTVQESSPTDGKAYFLTKVPGAAVVTAIQNRLILKPANGSADTAVVNPVKCMFEFKVRPNVGSGSKADHNKIEEDLDKVFADDRVIFLIGIEDRLYTSFSGGMAGGRGRPTTSPCRNMLLPLGAVRTGSTSTFPWKGKVLHIRYYRQLAAGGVVRVFAAIMQDEHHEHATGMDHDIPFNDRPII